MRKLSNQELNFPKGTKQKSGRAVLWTKQHLYFLTLTTIYCLPMDEIL